MKKYIFTALLLSQGIFAQQVPVAKVIDNFNKPQVEWQTPLPNDQKVAITWHERKSSLANEGIRTFVGYIDNQMHGVLSIYRNTLSGHITYGGKEYVLSTKDNELIIKEENSDGECGTCKGETHCVVSHPHENETQKFSNNRLNTSESLALKINDIPEIYTDGVLRVYRLAILVDYNFYRNVAQGNEIRVKQFWAETETFLNELYKRDLSIKFEIVKDEKLIRKNLGQRVFQDSQTPNEITDQATKKINDIIGENAYDVGVVASYGQRGLNGIGGLFSVYAPNTKANAWVSVMYPSTVAHEVGHLFGASHTYTYGTGGAKDTMNTEPYRGQSVMGYSKDLPRDFFALPSIEIIRKTIQKNSDYYKDLARTQRVGPQNSKNIVYGISSNNQPPVINRSRLKSEYTLPQYTYFQFHIPAVDPDGHSLRYVAHQADIRLKEAVGYAIVRSAKAQAEPTVVFYPQYQINKNGGVELIRNSAPDFPISGNNNERNFWLGVSDAGSLDENPDHAVRYDMFPTKVTFVDGTPFKILSTTKKEYKAGEKVTITWGVDKKIFNKNSKVRISLSDDLGETWKYVLAPETENDGSEEITIPNIELGKKQHTPFILSGSGVFKIEVLDHIAVAISKNHPNEGFEIKKSEISFENLPPQFISAKEGDIPKKANVIATSACTNSGTPLEVQFNESRKDNLITRMWTANDSCTNTASFTQYIEVQNNVAPLQFVGVLPKDIHIPCVGQAVEAPAELKVVGGSSPKVYFTQTKLQGDNENYTLKRTWTAIDADADPISHSQIIAVNDGVKPDLSEYPQDTTVKSMADLPPIPNITATDNCDGNVNVEMSSYLDRIEGKDVMVYSWTATDKSGNQTYHKQRVTIDPNHSPTLSVVENGAKNRTIIYPNPVSDSFLLNLKNVKAVKIYNAEGRLIKTFEPQTKYDVSRLVTGVYMIIVETQNGIENIKFIKK